MSLALIKPVKFMIPLAFYNSKFIELTKSFRRKRAQNCLLAGASERFARFESCGVITRLIGYMLATNNKWLDRAMCFTSSSSLQPPIDRSPFNRFSWLAIHMLVVVFFFQRESSIEILLLNHLSIVLPGEKCQRNLIKMYRMFLRKKPI